MDLRQLEPEKPRPLRRAEYDRLVELGLFEDERLELLHGVIVAMSPQDAMHSNVIQILTTILVPKLLDRAYVRVQCPLALAEDSEPEPDVAVVALGNYFDEHPRTAFLVIEVADTSLRKDREIKAALYARAGVREYWIVNLPDRVVEVHREPAEGGYRRVQRFAAGDSIALEAFGDVIVAVADLLPKRS